jgi:hypothetical protein
MGITLVIVGGLLLMTGVAALFDFLGKRQAGLGKDGLKRIEALEREVEVLKGSAVAKAEHIERLEAEVRFVNKLIEDRAPQGGVSQDSR